jgi:peroxiredoxin/tetratricopeptide (TPR) repeat protein
MRISCVKKLASVWMPYAVWTLCAAGAWAHEPGHSHQGEVFDRGPRQSAYLMGGTGDVHFPVTTKNPLVQKFIEQGVGQLHGFWYVEAERSFREAMRLDPACGIAYWGASLANDLHPVRAKQFAALAAKHKSGLSEREQMYIDALTQQDGYQKLIAKYPKDLEAKAFEVWRIWHRFEDGFASSSEKDRALDLAFQVLSVQPLHPMNHAVIHFCDAEERQARAIEAATRCGESAPSIGHMWHMPTHIFFNLRLYPEAAWQQEASIRTEHARMMHDRVLPDQVHLYAHNNEWLVRSLLYLGRVHDAKRVAKHMIDLPRHPLLNLIEPPEKDDEDEDADDLHQRPVETHGTSAYYGRERLLQVLREYEYWDELIEDCKTEYIEPTHIPGEQGKALANLGVAYYSTGDVAKGDAQLAALRDLAAKQAEQREAAFAEASSHKKLSERKALLIAADRQFARDDGMILSGIRQLESYRQIDTGIFLSRRMLIAFLSVLGVALLATVWFLRKRILLASMSVVALVAAGVWLFTCHLALWNLPYDTKNVDFGFMSRKQLEAGDPDVAEWCAEQYEANRPERVLPLANLIEIKYRIGKKDEARVLFDQLREIAGCADLDSPPLERLAPIAREFGLPTDWRLPQEIEKRLAKRRPLKSLGPLVWRPWKAPDWKLKDAQGRERSLAEFHGKPVLLVFFLGRGCLHCKQQLEALVRKAKQIGEQGITVIAVSTDNQAGIKKSLDDFGSHAFPFLMVADPELEVFQSYRSFDNFEQIALHGTFLIDPDGYARWFDVAAEPFMDIGFVLSESKRLLSRPIPPVEPGARVIADTPQPPALRAALGQR